MSKYKLCFIIDEDGNYKPVPHSKLMDGDKQKLEYENRFFIPLNGFLLEVSHDDYLDHYRTKNRHYYLQSESKRVGEVSLEAMIAMEGDFIGAITEDVADHVIESMLAGDVRDAVSMLNENDRLLVEMLFFDGQSEAHCAEVFAVNQSTVHRRKKGILLKLKNILLE